MPEKRGALLGLDIGTTHCKAGLFAEDGTALHVASRAMIAQRAPEGWAYFDPEETWQLVLEVLQEASSGAGSLAGIGIASMAETGLLVDRQSGRPRSPLLPWFDQAAAPQAERLAGLRDSLQTFRIKGIPASYKNSLAKILWWQRREPGSLQDAIWLPVASYIAYRLSGELAVDPSLAARTWAYRLDTRDWDDGLLADLGFLPSLFPALVPSGSPVGQVRSIDPEVSATLSGVPVAICGHDHLVAAYGAGAVRPGVVFDSLGTAETLIGAFPESPMTEEDANSGLLFGCHVVTGQLIWLGSLSTSGGSLEWLRGVLRQPPLSYEELASLLSKCPPVPGSILYFPYLSGSGSPHPDPDARGAFTGLSLSHTRTDLVKAVLEGTAYQMESIRRAAETAGGVKIERIRAAGGGTRLPGWLQMKADISGCIYEAMAMPEATLLGAALLAGVGVGIFANTEEALQAVDSPQAEIFTPDPDRHAAYAEMYEQYKRLAPAIREFTSGS